MHLIIVNQWGFRYFMFWNIKEMEVKLTEFNLRHEYKENRQPGHHLHSVGTVIGKLKISWEFGLSHLPFLTGFPRFST